MTLTPDFTILPALFEIISFLWAGEFFLLGLKNLGVFGVYSGIGGFNLIFCGFYSGLVLPGGCLKGDIYYFSIILPILFTFLTRFRVIFIVFGWKLAFFTGFYSIILDFDDLFLILNGDLLESFYF